MQPDDDSQQTHLYPCPALPLLDLLGVALTDFRPTERGPRVATGETETWYSIVESQLPSFWNEMMDATSELPWDQRRKIDVLADRFERAFKVGDEPRIEDFLEQHPDLRPHLLMELLALEIEFRRTAGDHFCIEEYNQRFPKNRKIVAALVSPDSGRTVSHEINLATEEDERHPEQLDRYEIRRVLGRGGFGVVYLAHDPKLNRPVALKIPHRARFQTPEQVASFVAEARTAANLKHPLLVTVYDVQEHEGLPFIVQEYIEGKNLGQWAAKHQPTFEQIARVLVRVAEALGYVHQQGLTHCDLKLANVLMDSAGEPHVADFGLAVHESAQALRKGQVCGTPAMMAPEQARGESHRFDGRTDIWAIGVMLYELTVGRKPFTADSRKKLFDEIQAHDPKPPRQIDRSVPRELERICLRCLAKRRSDRYNTTDDLREDLLAWLGEELSNQVSQSPTFESKRDSSARSDPQVKIIPKGLRSFDAEDADFFLELLPGPRDRYGLPESIRFWKKRIEETDPDKTFSVGLIYGPSGCGKSSLVKAGLIPNLERDIDPVYVEATPDDTELRLVKGLAKRFAVSATGDSLPDVLRTIRERGHNGRKLLIVLDQFEQWLHTRGEETTGDLVNGLRQCDGGHVQCIVMVRDDFWLAVSRFMQQLEVAIEENNSRLVDLFGSRHARAVLAKFGQAYGALPEESNSLTEQQLQFLDGCVTDLSEDGKVVCVRLALFAEMIKERSWTSNTLSQLGGTEGVGVTFLEETFSASTAPPPQHRYHQKAARAVLKRLLPASGSILRGNMRSYRELLWASDYERREEDFAELIRILDAELRLITPTDPAGRDVDDEELELDPKHKYYQLTHDYLVPPLRDWLTRKQKATMRGRAELRLAERSVAWNAQMENRNLAAWWEYLNIGIWTKRKQWTQPQREMMRRARFVHLSRCGIAAVLLLIAGIGTQHWYASVKEGQVAEKLNTLQNSTGLRARALIDELHKFPSPVLKRHLRKAFAEADKLQKLQLAFALAEYNDPHLLFILSQVDIETGVASSDDVANMVLALKKSPTESLAAIRSHANEATKAGEWANKSRLAVLAMYLGDISIAEQMLESTHPDPVQRTVFIAEFPHWSGPARNLAKILEEADQNVRSGISLALGSIVRPDPQVKQVWQPVVAGWYSKKSDSSTHSAAGWALRQWKIEAPTIDPVDQTPENRDWWHTPVSLTMLKIPAGQVPAEDDPIEVAEPFWLSDREVSIGLFKQFMDEADRAEKPDDWRGAHSFKRISFFRLADSYNANFDDSHPVQMVGWEDAILFCNWLSREHGFEECYDLESHKQPSNRQKYIVKWLPGTDGFRLPTADEWEYACRARTTTDFACGDAAKQLRDYAVFDGAKTEPCGSLLCNGWGLFDMHGNVWEWCWDAEGSDRVHRGGSWRYHAWECRSSRRNLSSPAMGNYMLGFRVALGKSASRVVSGAEGESR